MVRGLVLREFKNVFELEHETFQFHILNLWALFRSCFDTHESSVLWLLRVNDTSIWRLDIGGSCSGVSHKYILLLESSCRLQSSCVRGVGSHSWVFLEWATDQAVLLLINRLVNDHWHLETLVELADFFVFLSTLKVACPAHSFERRSASWCLSIIDSIGISFQRRIVHIFVSRLRLNRWWVLDESTCSSLSWQRSLLSRIKCWDLRCLIHLGWLIEILWIIMVNHQLILANAHVLSVINIGKFFVTNRNECCNFFVNVYSELVW